MAGSSLGMLLMNEEDFEEESPYMYIESFMLCQV